MPRRARVDLAALDSLALQQHSCVTLAQLAALGMPSSTVARRTSPRGGVWQRTLPGIVLLHNGAATARQRVAAALLYAGPGAVVTGAAALARSGVRAVPGGEVVELVLPASRHRKSAAYVSIERTNRMPDPIAGTEFPCAPVERAVVDHSRRMTDFRAVRALAAEVVQRRLCTAEALVTEVRLAPRQRTARIRWALEGVLVGIRSALEGDFRDLLRRAGLPEPSWNMDLLAADGAFIGAPDGWYAEAGVAIEVESREWHLRPDDWEATQNRRARFAAHSVVVVPVTHQRIRDEPAQVIAGIRQALINGASRPRLPLVAVRRSQAA